MERLIVEVKNNNNLEFLVELLNKFDFIHKIEKEKTAQKKKSILPIEWSQSNSDVMSLAGIWKNHPRTLEEIKAKAWKKWNSRKNTKLSFS